MPRPTTTPPPPATSGEALARIRRLTPQQREVLSWCAMNQDGGHHPRTLAVLVRQGLLEAREERLAGRLPLTILRYDVPVHVHLAYCAWAALEPLDDEDA